MGWNDTPLLEWSQHRHPARVFRKWFVILRYSEESGFLVCNADASEYLSMTKLGFSRMDSYSKPPLETETDVRLVADVRDQIGIALVPPRAEFPAKGVASGDEQA